MGGCRLAMTAVLAAGALWAPPPLTTIQDVLYKADGTPFNGMVFIEWRSFESADRSNIAMQRLTVPIVNGHLRVRLVPTTTAAPPATYRVRYNSDGLVQFEESWAVPPSATPLRVRDVRVALPPARQNGSIEIGYVKGLSEALEARPVKGAGYAPGRAVYVNASGALEGVAGNPADCVRVDGTSGPCGTGGGAGGATFWDGETPGGLINGTNAVFTLLNHPSPRLGLALYRNGLLQTQGVDYTLSGNVVTFASGAIPRPGDVLTAYYRVPGGVGAPAPAEVLCAGTGAWTSGTGLTLLGSCTIPGELLRPGDRVDIRFDYSHQGAGTGFLIEVRWGGTALTARSAEAGVTLVSGRADAAVRGQGVQWSAQSWGTGLSLSATAGAAPGPAGEAQTVEFLGAMAAETSETVTLENFTVIRYPAPANP